MPTIHTRNTEIDVKRRRLSYSAENQELSDTSVPEGYEVENEGKVLLAPETCFEPLTLVGEWEEPVTKTKRITVVLDLPSGVNKNDFTLRVLQGGMILELSATWPSPMLDLELLHQKWLTKPNNDQSLPFTMYHPAALSLEDALKKKRARANDSVGSTTHIQLPFAVQTQILEKSNLYFKDSTTKVVYVEFKAIEEAYAIVNDNDDFEEF